MGGLTLVGTPPSSAIFAAEQPSSGFWREQRLNGRHFPVAEGSGHRTQYTVFPVEAALLRAGDNPIEVRSDTEHHGIELLKPGPALVVRYRTR